MTCHNLTDINTKMKSFARHADEREYQLYLEAIRIQENSQQLNEFVSAVPGALRKYYDFIKDIAEVTKVNIKKIADFLKERVVFRFFKSIRFSLTRLFDLAKSGLKYYRDLQEAIATYIAQSKVGKWTEEKVKDLDAFLQRHPKAKRIAGVAVAGLLIYIWLNMSFTGDLDYDFDQTAIFAALAGSYSLTELFTGTNGMKLLTLLATGKLLGVGFPWPGPQSVLFIGSLLYGLAKFAKSKGIAIEFRRLIKR
jgi:hypothetical protein